MDFTIGRKGFLTYLKSLGGSNIVKVVPSNGSASGVRAIDKRLKLVCGSNTSYLEDSAWIAEKTPLTLCDIRVSPNNTVKPNLGALELSEALSRVLPFTAKEDNRPILQCVLFTIKDGKLTLVSADGYRLAVVKLDFDGDEGQVLIPSEDLAGVASALRKAKRVRISLEKATDNLDGMYLVLDTELIRYKWRGVESSFPEYEKLIPTSFNTLVSFDTNEAIKAVNSLKVLSFSKSYPIDLTIGNGKLIMSNPDEKGQVEMPADTEWEGRVRIDGSYLADALRACGGLVELKLTDSKSPMLFTSPDYELVVMPLFAGENKPPTTTETPQAEPVEPIPAETVAEETEKASAVAEAEAIVKAEKPKRKKARAKQPVAV
jgi:DNA polymerase III sliding clamp (beta) subunit (PCNA family)